MCQGGVADGWTGGQVGTCLGQQQAFKSGFRTQVRGYLEPLLRLLWAVRCLQELKMRPIKEINCIHTNPRFIGNCCFKEPYLQPVQLNEEHQKPLAPNMSIMSFFFFSSLLLIKDRLQWKEKIIKKLKPYVIKFKRKLLKPTSNHGQCFKGPRINVCQ